MRNAKMQPCDAEAGNSVREEAAAGGWTPGSQLGSDVANLLLERTTPDAAERDGNKTELAGCGFTVTDDEATGESMVVAYFTCNTPVEYCGRC
eukprot:jgi/Tetstr1/454314/TSEL_041233.t1